jgi:hypothetical protein
VQATALAARELADALLLIAALEVEAADVGAGRSFIAADGEQLGTAGDLLENGLVAVETIAALVDVGQLDGVADLDLARIRLLACRSASGTASICRRRSGR